MKKSELKGIINEIVHSCMKNSKFSMNEISPELATKAYSSIKRDDPRNQRLAKRFSDYAFNKYPTIQFETEYGHSMNLKIVEFYSKTQNGEEVLFFRVVDPSEKDKNWVGNKNRYVISFYTNQRVAYFHKENAPQTEWKKIYFNRQSVNDIIQFMKNSKQAKSGAFNRTKSSDFPLLAEEITNDTPEDNTEDNTEGNDEHSEYNEAEEIELLKKLAVILIKILKMHKNMEEPEEKNDDEETLSDNDEMTESNHKVQTRSYKTVKDIENNPKNIRNPKVPS